MIESLKLKTKSFLFIFVAFTLYSFRFALCASYAQPISSSELIKNALDYDGQEVVYEGEVIGDIMVRGEYAWINVRDENYALGIWLDKDLTRDILYTGSYKSQGDRLEISGVFHRACRQHGGDLDIHAKQIRTIIPGSQTLEKVNLAKRNLIFVLSGVLCLVLILRRLRQT